MKVYKVSEFKKLVTESSNEFKAKLGQGVESDNKTNSGKAYKDAEKRAKDYDGGLSDKITKPKVEKTDGNKGLLDYNPENVTDSYKKRVHAQVKGYNSEAEMKNGIEKVGDFEGNEEIYKSLKKHGETMQQNIEDFKRSGLQSRELPKSNFEKENMYENRNVKTVYFKKTQFLSESHMMSRVPDDFKIDGTRFKMKDKTGDTYLLEWYGNKAVVLEHNNPKGAENALKRMFELMNYQSSDSGTDYKSRLNESEEKHKELLDIVRSHITTETEN